MANINNLLIPFITINSNNLNLIHNYKVNNDIVFIFDIDNTLYESSDKMKSDEKLAWYNTYNFYKKNMPNVPSFENFIKSSNMFTGAFYKFFNKTPGEVELQKNFKYSDYIEKDLKLKLLLNKIPFKSWCFTNATKSRAEQILIKLGIINCFNGVICKDEGCQNGRVVGKPEIEAYDFVEKFLNIKKKSNVYFFDDSLANVVVGRSRGWNCYLIDENNNIYKVLEKVMQELKIAISIIL